MLISSPLVHRNVTQALVLTLACLAPAAHAEFGEHAIVRSEVPLAVNYLVPGQSYNNERERMEEVVVTAPRQQPSGRFRRHMVRVAKLLRDDPGGLELRLLPGYDSSELLAIRQQQSREDVIHQRFEPTGGVKLFRLTFEQ